MSVTSSALKRCSVPLYLQLFVLGLVSYLCYLCLFVHSGVQHILCCVFALLFFVLLTVSSDCPLLIPPSNKFFKFWVPCCDVRYEFRITTMFASSLPAFVCSRDHVLFTLYVFVRVYWCPTHIVLCFCCVVLRHFLQIVYFLLPSSVFSYVYLFWLYYLVVWVRKSYSKVLLLIVQFIY